MNSQEGMATPLAQIKTRLYGVNVEARGAALAELIQLGSRATPVLLEALHHSDPHIRRLAAEGLGELRDASTADALFQATQDANPEVRSRSATALYGLQDRRALAALVNTLDDYSDISHYPYTASMYPLMQGGKEVLPLITPLLRSPNSLTRERAFIVLQAVVTKIPEGQDWPNLWHQLGRYTPQAEEIDRNRSAQQWQTWVDNL